jgi:hypothetical protein
LHIHFSPLLCRLFFLFSVFVKIHNILFSVITDSCGRLAKLIQTYKKLVIRFNISTLFVQCILNSPTICIHCFRFCFPDLNADKALMCHDGALIFQLNGSVLFSHKKNCSERRRQNVYPLNVISLGLLWTYSVGCQFIK